MDSRLPAFDSGGFAVFFTLLLLCGLAVVLSMPGVIRFGEPISQHVTARPSVFFLSYVTMTAVLGLNRGSAALIAHRRRHAVRWVVLQILLAQVLLLPLLVLAHALAGRQPHILPLSVGYTTVVALMWAAVGYEVERRAAAKGTLPFMLKYAALGLIMFAPLLPAQGVRGASLVILASPLGAMSAFLNGPRAEIIAVAFLFPAAGIALELIRQRRKGE